jgi:hypothetical protein
MLRRPLVLSLLVVVAAALAVPAGASAASAPFGTSAVVLVSGFHTSSPFSTPACSTSGRGPTWGSATGPAAALSNAGYRVFTAPVESGGGPAPTSCLGGTYPNIPAKGMTINSKGVLANNGTALVRFLSFLSSSYGITSVQLVGHSDGGLWSREAITQMRAAEPPLTVTNLTTLGTPHTGSFGADIAEDLNGAGGSCTDLPPGVERDICETFFSSIAILMKELGPTATEELSSPYLAQWNPTTSIGCPVTVLGGDHVGFDVPGLSYYLPNDGIVGKASALAQSTDLPDVSAPPFTAVRPNPDLFDVVHSQSLEFLDRNTLLNTASVSAAVLASVSAPPTSACAAPNPLAGVAVRPAPATTTTVLFRDREATRGGTVRRPRTGDAILLRPGASAGCRGTALAATPLLGSRSVRVVVPRCSTRVTIRGRALRVGPGAGGERLRLARSGSTVRWKVTGGKLRHLRVSVRRDGRWASVSGSRLTVRPGAGAALRATGVERSGTVVRAFARLGG